MFTLPWALKADQNRYQFRVGKFLGIVEWWDDSPIGNWALYRGDELIESDVARTVHLARVQVEDAYQEWFTPPPLP